MGAEAVLIQEQQSDREKMVQILLVVIDGRQVNSLGASYSDVIELMLEYGAVNAANLDGGSSSLMYYNGEYINSCASMYGPRDLPTTIIVK